MTLPTMNLRGKLVAIYEELDHVEKAGRNKTQNYNFVRSADVLRDVRTAFAAHRIYAETNFTETGSYDIKTNSGGNMHASKVKVDIILYDVDSDETKHISGLGDGADVGDKGVYKAQTGAVKNALRNGLLLPDEADPEADTSVDDNVEPAPRREFRQPPPFSPAPTPRQIIAEEREKEPESSEFAASPDNGNINAAQAPFATVSGEQLAKYRARCVELQKKLTAAGLKSSRTLRVGSKFLMYLLDTTGAANVSQISTSVWEAFLDVAEQMDIEKLVKQVNYSVKLKQKEKSDGEETETQTETSK